MKGSRSVLIQLLQKQDGSIVPYKHVHKLYALELCGRAGGVDVWAWDDLKTVVRRTAFVIKT